MNLEVDKSAINKKLRIISDESPEQSMPWLQSNKPNQFSKPCKRVEPFPGACVKTWTENDDKLFINICHSNEICSPEDISDDKFRQMILEDVPGFVIPMAIGMEKMVKDKGDIERPAFDILINTKYFEKCMSKPHFWQFTITATIESINDKYNKFINPSKYIVLKNRKVMGSLDVFTIEDRPPKKPVIKKPLIQELGNKESDNMKQKPKIVEMKTIKTPTANKQYSKDESYIFLQSDDQSSIIAFFYLPLSSITDITIDVGENRIIVENQKAESIIDTFLPHSIDKQHVIANYDSKIHILRLILPLKKIN